jgi:hypothetical protein
VPAGLAQTPGILNGESPMLEERLPDSDHDLNELLNTLAAKGCTARVDEAGKLRVTSRHKLTADEMTRISAHRDELVRIVRTKQPQPTTSTLSDASGVAATAQNGADKREPLQVAQADTVEGIAIRLDVIINQLGALATAIHAIRTTTTLPITLYELADLIGYGVFPGNDDDSIQWHCSVHPEAWISATQNADGKIEFACEAGCLEAEIVFSTPALRLVSGLQDTHERSGDLTQALELTRSLLDEIRCSTKIRQSLSTGTPIV